MVETTAVDVAQLGLARQLISAYTKPFVIGDFKDHYEEELRELVEAKMDNLPVAAPAAEGKPAKVIDLMDALRRSLAQVKPAEAPGDQPAVEPIAGKTPEKAPARSTGKAKPTVGSRKTRSA